MTKTGMREAMEMQEILRETVCAIDHLTDYVNHCQEPTLRNILQNQQRHLVEEYRHTVSIMQGHGLDVTNLPSIQSAASGMQGTQASTMAGIQGTSGMQGAQGMPDMTGRQGTTGAAGIQGNMGHFGAQQTYVQAQPQYQVRSGSLSDLTICQGVLVFHKCRTTRATSAALESAEPHLRNLLSDSARTGMDMAYEVLRYMHQRGFYRLPEMSGNFVNHMQGKENYQGTQQSNQFGHQGSMPGQPS